MESLVERLRPLGSPIERVGYLVALYGTVAVLLMIGGLKFTAYEAEAIRPLVETSPLLSWAYTVFSSQGFSNLLGVVEIATGLLLAAAPVAPRLGVAGGGLAVATFAVTLTFLITGPAWEASLGGFPAPSAAGGFLIKDAVLLGAALAAAGNSLARLGGTVRRPVVARRARFPADRPI